MPNCRKYLFEDATETDDPTLVGENCHIVAEHDNGPRPNATMAMAGRNAYANLVLMCSDHHKVIDAQEHHYTVDLLHKIKADHEQWVREQLGFDAKRLRDDEAYASIVDEWGRLAHLDKWLGWSSRVLSFGQPSMSKMMSEDLTTLRRWLMNRIWPARHAELENAFQNFRFVLEDFHLSFLEHAVPLGDDVLITEKFYQIQEWNPERYEKLAARYNHHVDLVEDLMLELSRAANLICDEVRRSLRHSFRMSEGHLTIQYGPVGVLEFREAVVQYSTTERTERFPYDTLENFMFCRADRDFHFGTGCRPE